MPREIKFRAWDQNGKGGWLRIPTSFCFLQKDGRLTVSTNEVGPFQNCILEQSTGLKDKNGKEIYEGDIVWPPNHQWKKEVKWSPTMSGWNVRRKCRSSNDVTDLEVIGNIYESPELLEAKGLEKEEDSA